MRRFQFQRRAPGRPAIATLWWDICQSMTEVFLRLAFGLRVTGRDRIPREGPLLYLSNHQSFVDPAINGALINDRPFRPFARETLFKGPFGWLIHSLGALPVSGGGADKAVMRAAISELQAGRCVLIYPEGTRTPDGTVKSFKSGVAILLKRADSIVIPIGIDGAFDVWPRSRSWPRWRRAIECEAGDPITSAELLADGVPAAMERLEREIDVLRLRCRARLRARFGPGYPAAGPGDQSRSEPVP